VLDVIGWTPLVRLQRIVPRAPRPSSVTSRNVNPGGCVKGKIGTTTIEAAEPRGKAEAGGTIVDPNLGQPGVSFLC
jgi:cysteine synthase A